MVFVFHQGERGIFYWFQLTERWQLLRVSCAINAKADQDQLKLGKISGRPPATHDTSIAQEKARDEDAINLQAR